MDTGERLAAYLSGDLDPDERTALEADLAGDPALRARLERIRASDAALDALDDPALPEGFSARLHDRLAPELDAVLGDELAARRARRGRTIPWVPIAGAAATLALVVAGGIGLTTGSGGGDEDAAATLEAGSGEAHTGMADDALEAPIAPQAGPLVVDRGRSVTRDDLLALADEPDVRAAMADDLVQADPAAAARAYSEALGASTEQSSPSEPAADTTDGGGDAAGSQEADGLEFAARSAIDVGGVSAADRDAIAACVPRLFEDAAFPVVPVYAEVATDAGGERVVVLAALSPDADGAYHRVELWMFDRDSCEVREYVQAEPQPVERTAP